MRRGAFFRVDLFFAVVVMMSGDDDGWWWTSYHDKMIVNGILVEEHIMGEKELVDGDGNRFFGYVSERNVPLDGKVFYAQQRIYFDGIFDAQGRPFEGTKVQFTIEGGEEYRMRGYLYEDATNKEGRATYANGRIFQGKWNRKGKRDQMYRYGRLFDPNGRVYTGNFHEGWANFGVVQRQDGERYLIFDEMGVQHLGDLRDAIPCPINPNRMKLEEQKFTTLRDDEPMDQVSFHDYGIMYGIEKENGDRHGWLITPECENFYGTVDAKGKFLEGELWFEGGHFYGTFTDGKMPNLFGKGKLWMDGKEKVDYDGKICIEGADLFFEHNGTEYINVTTIEFNNTLLFQSYNEALFTAKGDAESLSSSEDEESLEEGRE